jgi:predicted XRE-type DNA-binding protein
MSKDVFKDIGFSDLEAKDLHRRSELLIRIQKYFKASRMSQADFARELKIDQPKVSKLINGRIDEFSLERLITFLELLGDNVSISVKPRKTKQLSRKKLAKSTLKVAPTKRRKQLA